MKICQYILLSVFNFLHLPFLSVQDWLTWNNAEIDYFWLVTLKSFSTMIIICTCRIICTLVRTQYPQDYVLWSQVWEFLRRRQFLEWISTKRKKVMDKLFKTRKRDLSSLCTPRSPSIAQLRLAVWKQHQNVVYITYPLSFCEIRPELDGHWKGWHHSKWSSPAWPTWRSVETKMNKSLSPICTSLAEWPMSAKGCWSCRVMSF